MLILYNRDLCELSALLANLFLILIAFTKAQTCLSSQRGRLFSDMTVSNGCISCVCNASYIATSVLYSNFSREFLKYLSCCTHVLWMVFSD